MQQSHRRAASCKFTAESTLESAGKLAFPALRLNKDCLGCRSGTWRTWAEPGPGCWWVYTSCATWRCKPGRRPCAGLVSSCSQYSLSLPSSGILRFPSTFHPKTLSFVRRQCAPSLDLPIKSTFNYGQWVLGLSNW